jgi:hypothetical protein
VKLTCPSKRRKARSVSVRHGGWFLPAWLTLMTAARALRSPGIARAGQYFDNWDLSLEK